MGIFVEPKLKTLKPFLAQYHPQVLREYERSIVYRFDDLTKGTLLMMLRSGFGGGPGVIRKVKGPYETHSIAGRCVLLGDAASKNDYEYLLYENEERSGPWYRQCYILSKDEYKALGKMNRFAFRAWCQETVGFDLWE